MSNSIKVKATSLKKFLTEKGHKVKHTECIEAVSMMETGQCYNVAKNEAIRILNNGEKLTFKELEEKDFQVEVVIPVDMDVLMNGIDAVNDYASEYITGCDYALNDISYEVYPYFYGSGCVAIKVCGYIEDIDTLQNLDDYVCDFEGEENTFIKKQVWPFNSQEIGYIAKNVDDLEDM